MRDPVQVAAIAVAIGLLLVWFSMFRPTATEPPAEPVPPPRAEAPAPEEPPSEIAPESARVFDDAPEGAAGEIVTPVEVAKLDNDAVRLRVSNVGGRVESIELLTYRDRIEDPAYPVDLVTEPRAGMLVGYLAESGPLAGVESAPHEISARGERRIEYRLVRQGVEVTRSLALDEHGYGGTLRLGVVNRSGEVVQPAFQVRFTGADRAPGAPDRFQQYQLIAASDGSLERMRVQGITSPGFFRSLFGGGGPEARPFASPVDWVGVESQYFLLAASTDNPERSAGLHAPLVSDTGLAWIGYPDRERPAIPPGHQIERVYRLYFGPKIEAEVAAVDERLLPAVLIGWGWVRPIIKAFAAMLVWSYDHVIANHGVGIILLTLMLRVATYPLTQKSMKSMKRFGEIAPLMKEVQEKYGSDRAKMSEAMTSLYREKGINPVTAMGGGCLPMLIQMPFMIALYFALQSSIELRHAPFVLWIDDLSAPEDFWSPFGIPIRPLPLLMGGSMLLQQRLSPQTGDPQQRQMMMWMSVIFTFMFYQFPSGLLLYWFVSNLLGIAQQVAVNRGTQAATKAAAAKAIRSRPSHPKAKARSGGKA